MEIRRCGGWRYYENGVGCKVTATSG
jgi:hypothetical protein